MVRIRRGEPVAVREGTLHGGLPFLAQGRGPVVVVLMGLKPENHNPRGLARTWELREWSELAEHRTVYLVRRRPGLPVGCTMADLAAELAGGLAHEFGHPVDVIGVSTGGSVALQLAIDHPEAVRRLVLLASAGRLSDAGRQVQRAYAARTAAGEHRAAGRTEARALTASTWSAHVVGGLLWLVGPLMAPHDPADLVRTVAAEDTFDVMADLHRIAAPTLVIGGARDGFYGAALFEQTAAGIPSGVLRLHPTRGHSGTAMSRTAKRLAASFLRQG